MKTGFKIAMVLAGAIALSAGAASAQKVKAGFVYIGPVGDHGWTYQHHQGVLHLQEELGDQVEVTFIENVSEGGQDAERVIRQLAQSGHDIIFTTSFGYMDSTLKVAAQYPNVHFEHATGYKTGANSGNYNIRFYEGRYVAGILAGDVTKSNTIGYIASFPIPEVVMGINSAYLGAKSVNPDVQFKIIWVSTWFDPGKEADAANALIGQGADVIFQHTDSPAAMQIAQASKIHAVGQASDMMAFGPEAQLTAIVNNWGPYYVERVKAVMDGTWQTQSVWLGFAGDYLRMGKFNDNAASQSARRQAQKAFDDIKAGRFHPFTGPLNRQDGSQFLADGEVITDEDLLIMDFYVEGIDGTLPQ